MPVFRSVLNANGPNNEVSSAKIEMDMEDRSPESRKSDRDLDRQLEAPLLQNQDAKQHHQRQSLRESLGDLRNFIRTLTYWRRQSQHGTGDSTSCATGFQGKRKDKVQRSKSFSIKCDKKYTTYYHIEYKESDNDDDDGDPNERLRDVRGKEEAFAKIDHLSQAGHARNNNGCFNDDKPCGSPPIGIHELGIPLRPSVNSTNINRNCRRVRFVTY